MGLNKNGIFSSEINSIVESPMAFNRNETNKVFYINYIRNVHILKELSGF